MWCPAWHGPDVLHENMMSRLGLFLHALLHALILQKKPLPPAAPKIAASQHRQESIPANMTSGLLYQPQDLISVGWCLHGQHLAWKADCCDVAYCPYVASCTAIHRCNSGQECTFQLLAATEQNCNNHLRQRQACACSGASATDNLM